MRNENNFTRETGTVLKFGDKSGKENNEIQQLFSRKPDHRKQHAISLAARRKQHDVCLAVRGKTARHITNCIV